MLPEFDASSVFLHTPLIFSQITTKESKVKPWSFIKYDYVKVFKYIHRMLKQKIFGNLLEPRVFLFRRLAKQAERVCKEHQIDAVVSTSPSFVTHLIASRLKRKLPRMGWLADYRDLWSGNPIFPGMPLIAIVEKKCEKTTLSGTDIITTVSEPLAMYLQDLHQKKVCVIPNGIEMDDVRKRQIRIDSVTQPEGKSSEPVTVLYTGSVLLGLYDLSPLFTAVSELLQERVLFKNDIRIVFVGIHDGIDYTLIKKKLSGVVKLLESVPRDEALRMQENADALLFLGVQKNGGMALDGVVTGKIFEYFTSGTEIIAIGMTKEMTVNRMIEESGVGICLGNDVEAIKDVLLQLVTKGKRPVSCSQSFINKFRRDTQAQEMYTLLQSIIDG